MKANCVVCGAGFDARGASKTCGKECSKQRRDGRKRKYRGANREAIAEYDRKYREANREAVAENKRQYYEANREADAENKRQYYEANRESLAENKRQYYEANREAILEKKQEYRQTVASAKHLNISRLEFAMLNFEYLNKRSRSNAE